MTNATQQDPQEHTITLENGLLPDHEFGRVCISPGVGAAILGAGLFPDLGDHNDGVPRFLLGLRGKQRTVPGGPGVRNEPECWDFPGGGVDFWELLEDSVIREVGEEFNLVLTDVQNLGFIQQRIPATDDEPRQHWISFTYLARIAPGSPRPEVPEAERSKITALRFFTLSEMEQLKLTSSMPPNIAMIRRLRPDLAA